ncbi:hypothetical protein ACFVXQ_27400 [Kitasatospora sp. NPDC058263]
MGHRVLRAQPRSIVRAADDSRAPARIADAYTPTRRVHLHQ